MNSNIKIILIVAIILTIIGYLYSCAYESEHFTFNPTVLKTPTKYNYTSIGCYKDNLSRMIPFQVPRVLVKSVDEATQIANKYGALVFGIQDGGQLFLGHDREKAIKLGKVKDCNPLGGTWTQQIYVAEVNANYTYVNIGCYKDSAERVIPFEVPNVIVKSVEEASKIANKFGAIVFGIQDNGHLFIGHDMFKAMSLGNVQCTPLGGNMTQQVYVALVSRDYDYVNIGCYKDNGSRMIPFMVPKAVIKTVDDAKRIANEYGATVFGIQDGNQLFLGFDMFKAISLGAVDKCPPLATAWTQQVYVAQIDRKHNYKNIGCFKDDANRMIPYQFPTSIKSVDEAKKIANKYGAPLFGIQNGSVLFLGFDQKKATSLGPATNCPELGGPWTNQVYVGEF